MKRGESEEEMVETNFCKINIHVNVNCSNYSIYIYVAQFVRCCCVKLLIGRLK